MLFAIQYGFWAAAHRQHQAAELLLVRQQAARARAEHPERLVDDLGCVRTSPDRPPTKDWRLPVKLPERGPENSNRVVGLVRTLG